MYLTKLSHLQQNFLYFDENYVHEDNLFTFRNLFLAEKVKMIPNHLYKRRIDFDTVVTKPISSRNVLGLWRFVSKLLEFAKSEDIRGIDLLAVMILLDGIFPKIEHFLETSDLTEAKKLKTICGNFAISADYVPQILDMAYYGIYMRKEIDTMSNQLYEARSTNTKLREEINNLLAESESNLDGHSVKCWLHNVVNYIRRVLTSFNYKSRK